MEDIEQADELSTFKTWDRCITSERDIVTKRELRKDEFLWRPDGDVLRPLWAKERLQNEAATIQFIARNKRIPVPACRLYIEDGLAHLETECITAGVLLRNIDEPRRPAAVTAVEAQMHRSNLPQLRSLRRNSIGSVDPGLPVFPPQRVYDRDRRSWERIEVSSDADGFVLCHNNLGPQNIFVCPETFHIAGIMDWEFAGYFPEYFELPLWRASDWGEEQKMYDAANERELGFLAAKRMIYKTASSHLLSLSGVLASVVVGLVRAKKKGWEMEGGETWERRAKTREKTNEDSLALLFLNKPLRPARDMSVNQATGRSASQQPEADWLATPSAATILLGCVGALLGQLNAKSGEHGGYPGTDNGASEGGSH